MMEQSDLVIANMTPFRGGSIDPGTAVEIGFMYARGRPVFGYTNVAGDYAARVAPNGALVDAEGMSIEQFGLLDRLGQVSGNPQFPTARGIAALPGGDEHDHLHVRQMRLMIDEFHQFKPVQPRHNRIE